jgi:squalene-hopene/tetraprenyl-beta-curcumene cyclase
MPRMFNFSAAVAMLLTCSLANVSFAADAPANDSATASDRAEAVIEKGLSFLKTQQRPDFGWQGGSDPPAISAIVLKAYMQNPKYDAEDKFLDKGFDKLLSYQKPDGSISADLLATYNTAIAISAIAVSKEAEYKDQLDKALNYLRNLQWTDKIEGIPDQSKKVDPADPNFGGFGYGKHGRADLSNVNFAVDALKDAGMKSDDPAFQAALKFVTRCQNNSETNDQKWAGDDGGFIYTCADGGQSPAGEYTGPDGRTMLRSYGSMSYAGLKSMIYAGLTKDDPRVKAAWKWVTNNWTLDENPGMKANDAQAAESGLFYYYHTLARALRAYGQPVIIDSQGRPHDWRIELIDKLAAEQDKDGSFHGTQKWMEAKPVLATSFAVLALQEAQADLKDHPAK